MMRVLVDVTHPAHVHLFRHAIAGLRERGHAVAVASREKDVTTDLLDAYGIEHAVLSAKRTGALGVAREWVGREARLFRFARAFDPDVVVSRLNPASAHVATALGVPNVVFHDHEAAGALARVTKPFADVVCTPTTYEGSFGEKERRYAGYHELAYLHPARFERDPDRLCAAGVDPETPYSVARFVSMDAHHDDDEDGISAAGKRELVETLAEHGDVYLSTEGDLPDGLDAYALPVPPADLHQLLAHADCYAGDSQTMATEAAVLGTPSVRLDTFADSLGNFHELESYGLVRSASDERELLDAVAEVAGDPDAPAAWRSRRLDLLADKIDVTGYMLELLAAVADE